MCIRDSRGDPEVSGNRVTMRLNELAAGQSIEISIPVRIKAGVADVYKRQPKKKILEGRSPSKPPFSDSFLASHIQ